jgi:hypothetical protein
MTRWFVRNLRFEFLAGSVVMLREPDKEAPGSRWAAEGLRLENGEILDVPFDEVPGNVLVCCEAFHVRDRASGERHTIAALIASTFVASDAIAMGRVTVQAPEHAIATVDLSGWPAREGVSVSLLTAGPPSRSLTGRTDDNGLVRFLVTTGYYSINVGPRPRPLIEVHDMMTPSKSWSSTMGKLRRCAVLVAVVVALGGNLACGVGSCGIQRSNLAQHAR